MTPPSKAQAWTIPQLLTMLTVAGILGGAVIRTLDFMGTTAISPDLRFIKMERYDSVRKVTVDSMFLVTGLQMDDISSRVDNLTDMTLMLVTIQCVNSNAAARDAARQARVPCAKVLRDQGITP